MDNKLDTIFENAMAAGKEIEQRKATRSLEHEQAAAAVAAAASEMEQAAIAGNESAYAQAKQKREAAQNRLEILEIRERKNNGASDYQKETMDVLNTLQKDSVDAVRQMLREFLSKYTELVRFIDSIENYVKRYNNVQEYFKSQVLKSNEYHIRYMAELLPIQHALDMKKKFQFQRSELEKAVTNK